MTDQLHLSVWLEKHARASRVKHFQMLLRHFPFSRREQPQSTVSIQAVSSTEPPLLERALNGPFDIVEVNAIVGEYSGDDIGYVVEGWWDLWQYADDWQIKPARVSLSCFGPEFDGGSERQLAAQEDLRIDFGVDSRYLPDSEIAGSSKMAESNIKSLLRLVHDVETILPIEERKLETESGVNFAERLQHVLQSASSRAM